MNEKKMFHKETNGYIVSGRQVATWPISFDNKSYLIEKIFLHK